MSHSTMVVMIVFISVGFGVMYDMYKKHLDFKEKMLKHNQSSNDENSQLQQQIKSIQERVQVLERIVTDEGYSIKKEINGL